MVSPVVRSIPGAIVIRIPRALPLTAMLALGSVGHLAPTGAAAQIPLSAGGELHGHVLEGDGDRTVAGARVELLDGSGRRLATTASDSSGFFRFGEVRPGAFRLRVSRFGYRTTTTPSWRVRAAEALQLEVRIAPDAVLLAPLTVVAARRPRPSPVLSNFRSRMQRGMGTFITRDDILARGASFVTDVIASVPGVHLESSGRGTRRDVYFTHATAARRCPAQIYIDGILLNRPLTGGGDAGIRLDDAVQPQSVEGIEIYRNSATVPAEFHSFDSRCGVVAVWTRRGPEGR